MVDRSYADLSLAALYDSLNPWGPGDDFYAGLVRSSPRVLDVGCGTGVLLAAARRAGHEGRLVGLDPAAAMLVQARHREPSVEWVLGDLRSHVFEREFDLVLMTGHTVQHLVGDEELRHALRSVAGALAEGGHFVFDTRNPAARAWESWTPDRVHEAADPEGTVAWVWHEVPEPPQGDLVTFTTTFEGVRWDRPQVVSTTLRFLDADAVERFLAEAGLVVVEQYGDWDASPVTADSPELITVARAV